MYVFGVGLSMQQPMAAIQGVLEAAKVAVGIAIIIFSQTLGGAVFICVAQNAFQDTFKQGISAADIPGLVSETVNYIGTTV
ncbi:MFS transporter [Akanthomyces lecanii RCEF 1005]|uniref:MFS transporter n=1 Tax=Akanthomyces lecanii RCEF 1005 TaxID=1081108 RepID=A0A167THP3_CORDF|nr:MFS transporter [Akanthomyces lecanii RCEF 1005]